MPTKADILAQLQRDILSLQGFRPSAAFHDAVGLGRMNQSFPNGVFPLAAVHEFFCSNVEEMTASSGFISGLLSQQLRKGGAAIWISVGRKIFPPALVAFGIQPQQVIFLDLKKEKDLAWVAEEALKCSAVAAVVTEMKDLDFTSSRRFQLAIEQSGVPCFVVRYKPKNLATTAVTRWQVKPLSSRVEDDLPGVGYPRWEVHLVKVRNGKPGTWDLEWVNGSFRHVIKLAAIDPHWQKKTG